jgi:ligand-binding sensor domain-containing protein
VSLVSTRLSGAFMRVPAAFKKSIIRSQIGGLLALSVLFFGRADAERLPIKTYTTADGLARNSVYRIVQDSRGFIWFCTAEGLSRFDGYRFANYTEANGLPGRAVNDMLETSSGQYLIATNRGLCRLNPPGVSTGKAGPSQSGIFDSEFATYDGADSAPGRKSINTLFQDRNGTIWCGTFSGLYRLEPSQGQAAGQMMMRLIDIGLPSRSGDDPIVQTVMEDGRGALWIGTRGSGLYRRWPSGEMERYTVAHGLPINDVRRVLEDSNGRLWAGTTLGLCRLAPSPRPERPIVANLCTKADGLPADWIADVFQPSGGNIWVGTTKGICECIAGPDGSRRSGRLNQRNRRVRLYRQISHR